MPNLPIGAGEILDESWQIVVIVTKENAQMVSATLSDVDANSYSNNLVVLACDDPLVRESLEAFVRYDVRYDLPAELELEKRWATVIASYQLVFHRVILLFAGARVPDAWDARLVAEGQRYPQAASVSPLSTSHPIFGAFSNVQQPIRLDVGDVDQWLNDYAEGVAFSVPVFSPCCLLLQGDFWQEEKLELESDAKLLSTLRDRGLWQVVSDQIYIDDSASVSNYSTEGIPLATMAAYEQRHPLMRLRHALSELCERGERPVVSRNTLPVQLHVGHSWGGGLSRWIADFLDADTTHNHLVLRSIGDRSAFGQQIALYSGADMGIPLRTWNLSQPIQSTVVSQLEYTALLKEIVSGFCVESLVVSSLIGHSLDVLATELPTTLVLHDFFPFCPALYACFASPCQSCNPHELRKCELENPLHSYFKDEPVDHWLSIRKAYLDLVDSPQIAIVAPSQSVIDRYGVLAPQMRNRAVSLVPHGLADNIADQFVALRSSLGRSRAGRLKIVVLGRVTADKGGDLLAAMLPELAEFADVHLLGAGENGDKFRELSSCSVVAQYSMESLQEHLQEIDPDLGLLLSVVPETFSYTLSELWAVGLPVMATNLGAFADRIEDGENGWLEGMDSTLLVSRLKALDGDGAQLAHVRDNIAQQPVLRATDMVVAYRSIHPTLPETQSGVRSGVPLSRFFLPRRTFQNPYQQVNERDQTPLYLQRTRGVEATYGAALREFLQYSAQKIEHTERIPGFLRGALRRILTKLANRL